MKNSLFLIFEGFAKQKISGLNLQKAIGPVQRLSDTMDYPLCSLFVSGLIRLIGSRSLGFLVWYSRKPSSLHICDPQLEVCGQPFIAFQPPLDDEHKYHDAQIGYINDQVQRKS